MEATEEELTAVPDIGGITAQNLIGWLQIRAEMLAESGERW